MSKIKILIPIYNDWKSAFKLLEDIDLEVNDLKHEFSIIIVNDCSTEEKPTNDFNFNNLKSIKIINMKINMGHARCNASGLRYIAEHEDYDYIIPMDGDGEDRSEEITLLINKINDHPDKVITANRVKRSESFFFKLCYFLHKYLTFIFTGQSIKFGNFICLPKHAVNKMIKDKATWSSFSGAVAKLFKDRKFIPSIRGKRFFGPSKMSFINLLKHSLSIIAVFKMTLLIRSIFFLIAYLFLVAGNLSLITLLPFIGVIIMMISVIILSQRENIKEFENSLENISSVDQLK
ncbi:glycosyltransferase [Candidatus Pelagibacter giovannonii]|uniref:Glycosyltransferase n=1 Tax=Candidatus Pelagibacter giovannonii TaxID=2563896 RepID=A0A6H1Q2Y4_9PROT|nr:glycosyltransferase [Candidatus Pelagibacter giovannonii]QIZ20733.1 glycosyltransferase [Candidatus Pelagibacter giovannonii]